MAKNWQKQSLTWGKRLVLVLVIMTGIGYGVMGLAERSPDALRLGLEDYISKLSGYRGEITDLTEAKLRPDVRFNMLGINIRDWDDKDKVYLHADSAYVAIPLLRMMFGSANYAALEVKGVDIATGYFLPQKLHLDFAGITDPQPATSSPQFVAEGNYNGQDVLATMEMTRKQTKKGPLYGFANSSLTTLKIGKTEIEGLVVRHFSSVSLESARLKREDVSIGFTAEDIEKDPLKSAIKGSIDGLDFNGLLTEDGDNIVLKITPSSTDTTRLAALKSLSDAVLSDLGLAGTDSKVRVEIEGLPATTTISETPLKKEEK